MFHTFAMKGMFLVKRARPDLEPGFGFLSSRIRASTQQNWSKLEKSMSFVLGTKDKVLTLSANESQNLHWHIDVAFRMHPDMRKHVSGTFRMDIGAISSSSTKQKVNSRSSTEAEVIVVDEKNIKVVRPKRFTGA